MFARLVGIKFVDGKATLDTSNNELRYPASSSVSDRTTGELLFFTDGNTVWNKNHTVMEGGIIISNVQSYIYPTIITPFPGNSDKYYIFSRNGKELYYAIVDIALNNGLGKVISANNFLGLIGPAGSIAAVNTQCMDGVWLLCGSRSKGIDSFSCYKVSAGGINPTPVVSSLPSLAPMESVVLWFKTNHAGNLILCAGGVGGDGQNPSVLHFDQLTGIVSNRILLPMLPGFEFSSGADFTENSKKLYISFFNSTGDESIVAQYSGINFSTISQVTQSTQKFFIDILLGPDNKVYLSSQQHDVSNNPNPDVIEFPDNDAQNCGFKENAIVFPNGRGINYVFPTFNNTSLPIIVPTNQSGVFAKNICLTDSLSFYLTDTINIDSVFLDFGDPATTNDTTSRFSSVYKYRYADTGEKTITAIWYVCGIKNVTTKTILVQPVPILDIGPDTGFCYKKSIALASTLTNADFLWNTNDKTNSITVNKQGTYWLQATRGGCKAYDTIKVKELPPILIEIGDNYTICDDGSDLVKLDAGKGFQHYKWTPTGDTTQWIIVQKAGEYYVIVEDYRGCKGDDDAKVLRICDETFYIPNAFTPNGDGLNDAFAPVFTDIFNYRMQIFNRWGEKLFESTEPANGWDGTYKGQTAPDGRYMWLISFQGNNKKILRTYNYNGEVYLSR